MESGLEKRDKGSGKFKSLVIGINYGPSSREYDWNNLFKKEIIQDSLLNLPLLIILERDAASFHVFNRTLNGKVISFLKPGKNDLLIDQETKSVWNIDGVSVAGPLKGQKLQTVQAYQEFWHSWKTFQPGTSKYK